MIYYIAVGSLPPLWANWLPICYYGLGHEAAKHELLRPPYVKE